MRQIEGVVALLLLSSCSSESSRQDVASLDRTAKPDIASTGDQRVHDASREARTDSSGPIEIAYDDGTVEEQNSPWSDQPGGEVAVCFTAREASMALVSARFYITIGGKPDTVFGVRVYESSPGTGPGQEIAQKSKITAAANTGNEWASVDLSGRAIKPSTRDFCLSMEWLTAPGMNGGDAQFLGTDKSAPDARSWWKTGPTTWTKIAQIGNGGDRDAMIRATVLP